MTQDRDSGRYVPALSFHWLTPFYDSVMKVALREKAFKQQLIRQMEIQPGQRILDLACGTGTLTIWVRQQHPAADVTGVDGDPGILRIARKKAEKEGVSIPFDQAMSQRLPYPDSHFDCVVSSLFFHHLSRADKQRTADELFRVLKPGGKLHVADWGRPANAFMRGLFVTIQVLDGFRNTRDNIEGRLAEVFLRSGFIDLRDLQQINTVFGTLVLTSATRADVEVA